MARYKCPCCGQPYNGQRCKSCYYEHFTEEITHGNHTHAGEPLVIRKPTAKTRPQPTIRRPSDCKPYAGKKKKKGSPLKWVVPVIVLITLLSEVREALEVVRVQEVRFEPDASVLEKFDKPDTQEVLEMPEDGLVLFDNGEVLVIADWERGREFEDPVIIWVQNDSDRDLTVTTQNLYVNGFQMENASFSCSAASGKVSRGELRLDEEELKRCRIDCVQQIRLDLWLLDQDLCPVDATKDLISLDYAVPG